jgi:hypothetical protein
MRTPAALLALSALGACAAAPPFDWGRYDSALYAYSRNPAARADYVRALEIAIWEGERDDRAAPGLRAELGYMRLEAGDEAGAIALFRAEAAAFPESAAFMQRIVARVEARRAATAN